MTAMSRKRKTTLATLRSNPYATGWAIHPVTRELVLTGKDKNIYGDLDLCAENVTSLPSGLTIHGNLHLEYNFSLTALPSNMIIMGSLLGYGCALTHLPADLIVNKNISLKYSEIKKLPDTMTHVFGDLNLTYTNVTKLPSKLRYVGGNLLLGGSKIRKLPKTLGTVIQDLDISGTEITTLPDGICIGNLFWNSAQPLRLPRKFTLAGVSVDQVPVVDNINVRVWEKIEKESASFDMSKWHSTCGTSHCRGGWAITLAGVKGAVLERKLGPALASLLIYAVSDPKRPIPDFYTSQAVALKDIKERARLDLVKAKKATQT